MNWILIYFEFKSGGKYTGQSTCCACRGNRGYGDAILKIILVQRKYAFERNTWVAVVFDFKCKCMQRIFLSAKSIIAMAIVIFSSSASWRRPPSL